MSITVLKYCKNENGDENETPDTMFRHPQIKIIKKTPELKMHTTVSDEGGLTKTIPLKRLGTTITAASLQKSLKYQSESNPSGSNSALSAKNFHQIIDMCNTDTDLKKQQLGAAISSLPPTTTIKATTPFGNKTQSASSTSTLATPTLNRPTNTAPTTVYIKRDMSKRTMRSHTLELIQNNPLIHLGIGADRFPVIKQIIRPTVANVTHLDCVLTLKKLRQNESFVMLSEYFELPESEVEQIFVSTIVKLARYMRFLIRWPNQKQYYERHKYLPFAFRAKLSAVQSLIECVETSVDEKLNLGFSSFKFIYCINSNGIISFISDVYRGDCDDIMLFEASDFKSHIPNYLTMVVDPGVAIRRVPETKSHNESQIDIISFDDIEEDYIEANLEALETDSSGTEQPNHITKYEATRVAGEIASTQTLSISNNKLKSNCVENFSIPVVNTRQKVCRDQMREAIDILREFKILQPCAIEHPLIFEYINEVLIVCCALTNLQR